MLTAGLLQLNGMIDNRPDLFYVRYVPNTVYADVVPEDTYPYPDLLPALRRVCSCESTGNASSTPVQFNADGTVLRGAINPLDRGMCQINLFYHGKESKALGMDVSTVAGNIAFANYLYQREGLQPWSASRSCWDKKAVDKSTLH